MSNEQVAMSNERKQSKLDELIQQYCPDGVPNKTLGELGKFFGGLTGKSKDDFTDGNAKFITYKNVYANPALQIDVEDRVKIAGGEKQRTLQYGDVVFTGSSETPDECGISSVVTVKTEEKLYLNSFCFFFRFDDLSIMLPDFAKHLFRSNELRYQIGKTASGVTRYNVSKKLMEKVSIPVPPLPVQSEIVRILDNFTFLTTELAAELAARQKQYEYYRDLLFLSLKAEYRFIPEFAKTYIGLVTTMTQHYVKEGVKLLFNSSVKENHFDFPKMVYLDNEFAEKNSSRMHKLGDIITVHTGDVGTSAIIDETLEGSLGFATIVTRIYNQEDVLPKYVSYYLNSNENKNNIYKLIKGDRNNLNLKDFNKLRVPIPSLEQQQRIVDILDRFDTLCNDISSGLPAEIEIRQKQYEYYRDKLLTFKELKKEA